jgi:hypothetical protein
VSRRLRLQKSQITYDDYRNLSERYCGVRLCIAEFKRLAFGIRKVLVHFLSPEYICEEIALFLHPIKPGIIPENIRERIDTSYIFSTLYWNFSGMKE